MAVPDYPPRKRQPTDDVRVTFEVDTALLAQLLGRAESALGYAADTVEQVGASADAAAVARAVAAELHTLAAQCRVVYEQGKLQAARAQAQERKKRAGLN